MPKTETAKTDWEGTDRYYVLCYHQRAVKLQFPPTIITGVRLQFRETKSEITGILLYHSNKHGNAPGLCVSYCVLKVEVSELYLLIVASSSHSHIWNVKVSI